MSFAPKNFSKEKQSILESCCWQLTQYLFLSLESGVLSTGSLELESRSPSAVAQAPELRRASCARAGP